MADPPARATAALLAVLLAAPAPGAAQRDSLGLHTTLQGWADDALLAILDRDAARGGRLSDRGILQRFWPDIDPDYQINLLRMRFDLPDDYEWYRRPSGARYWGGSVNTRDEAIQAEFKTRVPLGGAWAADADLLHQHLLELARTLVRLALRRTARSGAYGFLHGTFPFHKPSAGVGLGAGWARGAARVELALTALAAFNNLIYNDLKVQNTPADTALDYVRQPYLLHGRVELPLGRAVRVEGHAGVMRPALLRAFVQAAPDSGFLQGERYGFAGGLLEWSPAPTLTAGSFATVVRAVADRTPLPDGGAVNDFALTERSVRAGAVLLARPAPRWLVEAWLERWWRPERRVSRRGAGADVNYEDVSWTGQAVVFYRPPRGFTASVGLDVDRRDVVRGAGEVPSLEGSQARHNHEVRLDFGWRFANRSLVAAGLGLDLDPGIWPRGWFGGAHGRFVLYW
jgi:hypothetical protein